MAMSSVMMSVERQESVMIAHVVHGGSSKSFIPKMHTNLLEEHTMIIVLSILDNCWRSS